MMNRLIYLKRLIVYCDASVTMFTSLSSRRQAQKQICSILF
jgi:hypothetical protein